jgi:hypothetical protein
MAERLAERRERLDGDGDSELEPRALARRIMAALLPT